MIVSVQARIRKEKYPVGLYDKKKEIRVGIPRNPCYSCDKKYQSRIRIVFEDEGKQRVVNWCTGCIINSVKRVMYPYFPGKVSDTKSNDDVKCDECGDCARGGIYLSENPEFELRKKRILYEVYCEQCLRNKLNDLRVKNYDA